MHHIKGKTLFLDGCGNTWLGTILFNALDRQAGVGSEEFARERAGERKERQKYYSKPN